MANKLRIPVERLQIGMSVVELDRPWIETPFLLQGFTISNRSDISAVQEYCKYVYIDAESMPVEVKRNTTKKKPDETKKPGFFNELYKRKGPQVSTSVEKEISTAARVHKESSSIVSEAMEDIMLGNAINEEKLKKNITDTVDSIVRNPDAMMWLTRLQNKDSYTSQHSVNCCILAVTFGRYMKLPNNELEKLAVSGLMHDIGKLQLPTEILTNPGYLKPAERKILKTHPNASRNLLMSAGKFLYPAVDVAYAHHERLDGSGYPRGLKAGQISPFARMLAIIDTYDTMTTEQVYQEERTPFEALKMLNSKKGTHYDESLVKLFIKLIGVFPVGSLVEMTTREIGIVITSNRQDALRPKVLIMLDNNKMPCERKIMNLARNPKDALGRAVKIAKTLRKGDYGIDQQQLIQEGVEFTVVG